MKGQKYEDPYRRALRRKVLDIQSSLKWNKERLEPFFFKYGEVTFLADLEFGTHDPKIYETNIEVLQEQLDILLRALLREGLSGKEIRWL